MTKADVTNFFDTAKKAVSRRSPEILIALGVTGFISTTILAVKATPKALQLIEAKKKEEDKDDLTALETVQATWKCYVPAVVTGAVSTACVIGANSVNAKRNAALATAYKLSETAFREFKEKAIETVGEKKVQTIREKIAQDKVDKNPPESTGKSIIITGNGNTLCLDGVFNQYFESSKDAIERGVNNLNYRMLSEQYASLNDLYEEIGVDRIEVGDMVGWNLSRHGMVEVEFDTALSKDNRPCLVIHYNVAPVYDYQNHW